MLNENVTRPIMKLNITVPNQTARCENKRLIANKKYRLIPPIRVHRLF